MWKQVIACGLMFAVVFPVYAGGKGLVEITSEPAGAKVFVNGQRKGNTPQVVGKSLVLELEEGEYKLEAKTDDETNATFDLYVANGAIQPVHLKLSFNPPVSNQPKAVKNSIGMEFVLIPAGEFTMGSNEENNEKPSHNVRITQPFYMGKTEVTQAQWKAVMGNNPSSFKGDDLPVETVSWKDAQEFITALNKKENSDKYRLPSEAEWEYAARAGSTTKWHFGDDESLLGDYAWYGENSGNKTYAVDGENSGNKTHAVAGKKPNKYGLYDMAGNVLEWNQDSWEDNYNTPRTQSPYKNSSENHLLRGGAWLYNTNSCRSAYRSRSSGGNDRCGFRVVFPAPRVLHP